MYLNINICIMFMYLFIYRGGIGFLFLRFSINILKKKCDLINYINKY